MNTPPREERLAETFSALASPGTTGLDAARPAGLARTLCERTLHWLPVLATMILFTQVTLLGLRPALCEHRRLAEAEIALRARWERDVELRDRISANLRAREDPIFVERQRRLREGPTRSTAAELAAASAGSSTAE